MRVCGGVTVGVGSARAPVCVPRCAWWGSVRGWRGRGGGRVVHTVGVPAVRRRVGKRVIWDVCGLWVGVFVRGTGVEHTPYWGALFRAPQNSTWHHPKRRQHLRKDVPGTGSPEQRPHPPALLADLGPVEGRIGLQVSCLVSVLEDS